jgi:hypothetical protein
MMSAHWADTSRCVGLAQDLLDRLNDDTANHTFFRASQNRIEQLLSEAPVHRISALPDALFAAHSAISKAY